MKKIISIVTLLVCLVGCGGGGPVPPPITGTNTGTSTGTSTNVDPGPPVPPVPSPFNIVLAEQIADISGFATVSIYLAVKQPPADSAKSLQLVIDTIGTAVRTYPVGGFASMQQSIMIEIALVVQDPAQLQGANIFCGAVLGGLDVLFTQHPDWQNLGSETSLIIQSFVVGCDDGFATYQAKSYVRMHGHRWNELEKEKKNKRKPI